MKILNQAKKTSLSEDAKLVGSFFDKLFGLLVKSNPGTLIFRTRFGLHTFFLKDPIDVIVLDGKNRIRKMKKNLQPNRFFFWNLRYQIVIELPRDTIKKSRTSMGDKLKII